MLSVINGLDLLEGNLLKKFVPSLANAELTPMRWDGAVPYAGRAFDSAHRLYRTAADAVDIAVDSRGVAIELVRICFRKLCSRGIDSIAHIGAARPNVNDVSTVRELEGRIADVTLACSQRVYGVKEAVLPKLLGRKQPSDTVPDSRRAATHTGGQ